MNLRDLAEQDLAITLEDGDDGFGWDITITNPSDQSQTVKGQYHRVSVEVDPETGMQVRSKRASITIRNSTFTLGIIAKTWKVTVTDINGVVLEGVVSDILPDDTLGVTTMFVQKRV